MRLSKHLPKPVGMQLAPMIDIVFQLLIFFIITWQFARDEVDLKVKVPTTEQGKAEKRPLGEIIINVRKSGVVIVDGQEITHEALKAKLVRLSKAFPDQPVRLRGDENCSWQEVVKVVDVCREGGIWNFSFATQLPQ